MSSARRFALRSAALAAVLALGGTLCGTANAETAPSADPGITVKVDGGPYLVGQTIPVEITVTNHGSITATGVKAYNFGGSGSYLSINSFGPLGSSSSGASIPAGEKVVVDVEARVYNWQGAPVARFSIGSSGRDSERLNNTFDLAVPMTAPDSGRGSISGLVYGDANGNGVADAGEGLEDVQMSLSGGLPSSVTVRTAVDGRYSFADLPLRTYGVYASLAPNGWVVLRSGDVNVDGDEYLEHRAVRPLSDQLEASVDFTEDTYAAGQAVQVTVVLTNRGDTDLTGVKAGCDRSGEGPHVTGMALGDLAWNAAGVTVGAGQSLTLTVTGAVPARASGFAYVSFECDFGPGDSFDGHPAAYDRARVPGAGPGGIRGVLYHDRDQDWIPDADEFVAGLEVAAVDGFTGQVVATTSTDTAGVLEFTDLPAGPYELELHGPWKFSNGRAGFVIGTCGQQCDGGWSLTVVPTTS